LNAAAGLAVDVLLVEHMKCRKANVCDLFFTEYELMTEAYGRRLRRICRRHSRCRRSAYH
jgi:hypothetical protein